MAADPSWQDINCLVEAALDLPDDDRPAFVVTACGADEALRHQVEALLAAERQAVDFLELPAFSEAWESGSAPRIGPYRLLREIGRGGMSTVYLALRDDDTYRQKVAIKVLRLDTESGDLLRRFHNERQILAELDHPSIGRLLDGGNTATDRPYFVMEHIEGEPIDAYCDARRLDLTERIKLFRQVCAAVQHAHQNLIVHRDLKPSNILVTAEGTPKLLDFGIAKLLAPSPAIEPGDPTETWQRVLTPQYASPEQVQGEPITTASDVYSLGVVLYKLLSGQLPYRFDRRAPAEVERLICDQEPPWPSVAMARRALADSPSEAEGRARRSELRQRQRRLVGDLDHIVMKALRKEPRQRYLTVEQLDEDLLRYLVALPIKARQGTLLYRAQRFWQRNLIGVAVAAAFLILILGFATLSAVQSLRMAHQRDQAQQERAVAQRERQRAERISSFLVELFELSDPEKALGRAPSARQLLDRGAARIARELRGQPQLQAELMGTMGRVYHGLGLFDEGKLLFQEVLKLQRDVLDVEPLEIARTQSHLAQTVLLQGELRAAELLCREALSLRRQLLPGEHPDLAQSLDQLGLIRMQGGDYLEADRLLREALTMRQRLFGIEHRDVVSSLHHLAANLSQRGSFEEAETYYRQALNLAQGLTGDQAAEVAAISNDLAMVLGGMHRYREAAELLRSVLDIYKEILASEHPSVAMVQGNLAGMLVELGQYEEAETLARRALELRQKLLGEDYFGNASTLLLLGRMRFFAGLLDEAETYCHESLALVRQELGARHPHSAHPLLWLGRIDLARGRPAAAEPLLRQALTIWQNTLPDGHPFIARAGGALGIALVDQGRVDEGRSWLEKSYLILEAQEGEEAELTRWVRGHHEDAQGF